MPSLELSTDQVISLISQLSTEEQHKVLIILQQQIQYGPAPNQGSQVIGGEPALNIDEESKLWLEADLNSDLPPYEWGEDGEPSGRPITLVDGIGLVISKS